MLCRSWSGYEVGDRGEGDLQSSNIGMTGRQCKSKQGRMSVRCDILVVLILILQPIVAPCWASLNLFYLEAKANQRSYETVLETSQLIRSQAKT